MKQFDEKTYGRMQVAVIPSNQILPNPYQPRRVFDALAMQELADSIRQHGVMQPISVRKMGAYYELIAGERRLRASKMAGYTTIPAIVFCTKRPGKRPDLAGRKYTAAGPQLL